jgi:hypothetical protein
MRIRYLFSVHSAFYNLAPGGHGFSLILLRNNLKHTKFLLNSMVTKFKPIYGQICREDFLNTKDLMGLESGVDSWPGAGVLPSWRFALMEENATKI